MTGGRGEGRGGGEHSTKCKLNDFDFSVKHSSSIPRPKQRDDHLAYVIDSKFAPTFLKIGKKLK